MENLSLRKLAVLLAALIAVSGMALLVLDPLPLQALRNQTFDQYQRWQPRTYEPAPVRIVDIDDESLAQLGQWPWPRTRLAELVRTLHAAGAAAIGFDVVFAEPDRTSPRAMIHLWEPDATTRAGLRALPDHDEVFAQSLKGAGAVVGFAALHEQESDARLPAKPYRYVWSGTPAMDAMATFPAAVSTLPLLEQAADGVGSLSFDPDSDGVVRRVPLVFKLAGEPAPTLAAETLRVGQGATNYLLRSADAGGVGLAEVRIGALTIPTSPSGEVWVHYTKPVPERYVPVWKVLAGAVPPELLDGHLVLIGASAQGLMDLRFNTLGSLMPGVEAHAQALEQILTEHHLRRPGWATGLEFALIVLGGVLVAWMGTHLGAGLSAGGALLLLGGTALGGWLAFSQAGLLINTVTPMLVLAAGFVLTSLLHHLWSEHQQRWVKQAFSRYVSPNLVEHLVGHPGQLELGGSRRQCSFVFTDLAGFTGLMEKIDPGEAVAMLNVYLDEMIAIAFRHDGTLDRIVGDAVAIMFSAPLPQPDHQARALACAQEMLQFANGFAAQQQARGVAFGHTRIGVHSGEVIVGNFGGTTMFDYRALGDPVNTAARLESVNKHLGTRLCVSEAVMNACPDAAARPIARLVLKGKTEPLKVFEPLPTPAPTTYAPLDDYLGAYALLEAGAATDAALEAFRTLAQRWPDDPLPTLHLRRLEAGETGEVMVLAAK